MHLLACFPGRKMFVLRTCPFVFSSFPFFGSDAFGWACVRIGDEQRDSSRFWDVSLAIDLCFPIAIDETTPPHTHIEKNTRFLCCCIFFLPYAHSIFSSLPDRNSFKNHTQPNVSLTVQMETELAQKHIPWFYLVNLQAHQTVSCWPSEWVSARSSGWYSIQCIHTVSTGWAIQRITRFYLPRETTKICHYLILKMRLPAPRAAQAPPALIATHCSSM